MAPATKYGGKIDACQPGVSAMAKSKETTECTESTSGVEKAARNRYAFAKWRHSRSLLRQPSDRMLRIRFRIGFVSLSRSTAMSGMRPMQRNDVEIARYVEIANACHTSGD